MGFCTLRCTEMDFFKKKVSDSEQDDISDEDTSDVGYSTSLFVFIITVGIPLGNGDLRID